MNASSVEIVDHCLVWAPLGPETDFFNRPPWGQKGVAMTLTKRAECARHELFRRYDHLNALWFQAEEELTKLHIPQPVSYVYASYDDDPYDGTTNVSLCLGLQKVKGKWRICHTECPSYDGPGPYDWTPITDCSAETRVRAAKYLPEFREAVVKSAEQFIPKVDEAIKAMQQALNTDIQQLLAERAKLNGRK